MPTKAPHAAVELSDREWRQMRRQLSELVFDAVPETPEPVPRSFYNELQSDASLPSPVDDKTATAPRNHQTIAMGEREHSEREPTTAVGEEDAARARDLEGATGAVRDDDADDAGIVRRPNESHVATANSISRVDVKSLAIDEGREQGGMATKQPRCISEPAELVPVLHMSYQSSEDAPDAEVNRCERLVNNAVLNELETEVAQAQAAIRQMMMAKIMSMREQLLSERRLESRKLQAAHANDVTILQNRIEQLKERLARSEVRHQSSDAFADRYSEFVARRMNNERRRWEVQALLTRCLRVWGAHCRRRRKERRDELLARRYHSKRCLRRSFQRWNSEATAVRHVGEREAIVRHHQQQVVTIATEYQIKIRQLQMELEESHEQLAVARTRHQQLEGDLRKVFLRGVSAMNIEALTLFNATHRTKDIQSDGSSNSSELVHPAPPTADVSIKEQAQEPAHLEEIDAPELDVQPEPPVGSNHSNEEVEPATSVVPNAHAEHVELEPPEQSPPPRKPTAQDDLQKKLHHLLAATTPPPAPAPTSAPEQPEAATNVFAVEQNRRSSGNNGTVIYGRGPPAQPSVPAAALLRSASMIEHHGLSKAASSAPHSTIASSQRQASPLGRNGTTNVALEVEYMRSAMARMGTTATRSSGSSSSAGIPARLRSSNPIPSPRRRSRIGW